MDRINATYIMATNQRTTSGTAPSSNINNSENVHLQIALQKGETQALSSSYSLRAEPTSAGSRRSLFMHVAARMHAADGPGTVHKAAAIQSHPKSVISMRPRHTLLPPEAGMLIV